MKLISEQFVLEASKRGERTIAVEEGTIVTAAARDRARQLGITLGPKKNLPKAAADALPPPRHGLTELIALGSDHGGYQMKQVLKPFLELLGHKVVDLGTYSEE